MFFNICWTHTISPFYFNRDRSALRRAGRVGDDNLLLILRAAVATRLVLIFRMVASFIFLMLSRWVSAVSPFSFVYSRFVALEDCIS